MALTWLSIRVELVSGRGQDFWPRPGRVLAASRSHTFEQLAEAIDSCFARWDRSHLYRFDLSDGIAMGSAELQEDDDAILDGAVAKLSRLKPGDQFVYEFDLGDNWEHLVTVGEHRIDPAMEVGVIPQQPTAYWGWGDIPDQYGRRWEDDDGDESVDPDPNPNLADLPPIRSWWGPPGQQHAPV